MTDSQPIGGSAPALVDIPTTFCRDLTAKFADVTFYPERGRAFTRIVREWKGGDRSVYCFIDNASGDAIKAAGWKAPQRDKDGLAVRFRLADPADYATCLAMADPYGGVFYQH